MRNNQTKIYTTMTKTTFTAQGYTCPECKTIELSARRPILDGSPNYGSAGAAGGNVNVNFDDEDY